LLIVQKIYHAVTSMTCSNSNIKYSDIFLVIFQKVKK
jgi:hypothetical protein